MRPQNSYQRLLASRGIPLVAFGGSEIALARTDALMALELLKKASVGILGGDVYFRQGSRIELAMANWHSDPRDGEHPQDFAERSNAETYRYINQLPSNEDFLFVFVLKDNSEK